MPDLNITPNDIETAMQSDENVSLKIQLIAAMRRITELELELARNGDGNLEAESKEDSKARERSGQKTNIKAA